VKSKDARNKFLVLVRNIVSSVLAFFRGTEADACALLSAYGLYALELDRLQDDRASAQKTSSAESVRLTHSRWDGGPVGPIPVGVHPQRSDSEKCLFLRTNYATQPSVTANGSGSSVNDNDG
jgi:hypothetical protein